MDLAIPPDLSDPPEGVKVITEILEGDVVTDRAVNKSSRSEIKRKEVETSEKIRGSAESSQIKEVEVMVQKVDIGEEDNIEEGIKVKEKGWSEVSPAKAGKVQTVTLQNNTSVIAISTSKFSVLMDEEEEGNGNSRGWFSGR
ncbi:hypothetical protein F2Q70_00004444 [Brassica cretica]|uniref:Uncharacterized protein n=1 Tax=Brassica cretica TaxID=69181 RepID=A0A8S9J127_BRACR|nr:hypothetical protein F2Q70_00004444 [Brassica cretica]